MTDTLLKHTTFAKLAEQAERYEEMAESMRKFVLESTEPLAISDRNLLSVAYKNVVGSRRSSWRSLNAAEQKSEELSLKQQVALEYRKVIANELVEKCEDILGLIPQCQARHKSADYEDQVFYHKMKGDYNRYVAEVEKKRPNYDPVAESANAYEEAMTIATAHLAPTHQVRLGLALNYSVFFYEILVNPEKACEIAKKAFDDAIADLDSLAEDSYKDSTLIMQLLRDNLTLWTDTTNNEEQDA
ncbi:hypothetical protein HZS_5002, partial [Henneguya salminicola]